MKTYFCLLCVESVHLPSVLLVHKGGPGRSFGLLWFSAMERAQPQLGRLFPAWAHLQHLDKQGMSGALSQIPRAARWDGHLPCSPALSGEIFLSCCREVCKDPTGKEWAQVGWSQRWSPSCPGFIPSFPCQAKASEQLRSYISSSAPSPAASSKCLFQHQLALIPLNSLI